MKASKVAKISMPGSVRFNPTRLTRTISSLSLYLLLGAIIAHAGQFLDAPQYTAGTNPQSVAVGDFNGDGKQDMAVVNSGSATVSILLGNGDGTFKTKKDYATGSLPYGIAVGDFNGDGKLDLAVTNSSANTLSILLGNGDGSFKPKVDIATGTTPQGIAVGDFNGDNKKDLVVTNASSGNAGVFIGNGDGTFKTQVLYNTLGGPTSVVVADFNGDGKLDFAVANKNTFNEISVYLGNGNGTFGSQFQNATGGTPVSITAGDFNGDGKLDLAVAVQTVDAQGNPKGAVSVLLGTGTGAFAGFVNYNTAAVPTSVATGDFNGDGVADLAISSGNDNTISLLIGIGNGTFKSQINYGTGDIPYSAVVADLNGDGRKDIVVANYGAASASVLVGNGDGTFQTRTDFASGPNVNAVVVADFNGDGIPDLAFADSDCVANCLPNAISVIVGNGDGTFQAPNTFSTGSTDTNTYALAAADFNGDKKMDIVAVNNATANISILIGNGDGTFQPHVDYAVGSEPASVAIGDFNGDGHLDLVVSNFNGNTLSVLIGNGDGTFKAAVTYAVGHGPYSVAVADFNGDKKLDLVVVNESDNNVGVLLGKGDGTFGAENIYLTGTGGNPVALVVGDFNGDNVQDVVVADYTIAQVSVLIGKGDGTFQPFKQYPTVANPSAVVAGDFNGDGFLDLALASTTKPGVPGNLVSFLPGKGDGTFNAPTLFPTGSQAVTEAQSIAAADVNGDGALDLLLANGLSSTATVLLNAQGAQILLSSSAGNPSYGQPVTFTANIAASVSGAGTPTGTITFSSGSTVLGTQTISGGTTSLTTSALPVSTTTISAAYSGDANFQKHTVTIAQMVSQAGTNTSVASSLNPSALGQPVTFTATVCPPAASSCPVTSGAPTGTVTFLDGTTTLGTGALNASGSASFTTSTLSITTHAITTSYSGDSNYSASVSPTLSQVVNAVAVPAFTLAASTLTPASVAAGGSSTSTITITPSGGLDPTKVALSCTTTPAASKAPMCSFGTISSTGQATLTVSTTAATTALVAHPTSTFYAMWLLLPGVMFGSVLLPRKQRGKLMMVGAVLFISAGCIFLSACGGGSPTGTPTTVPGTPSGAYSITVMGAATGATSQTAGPLTLTVQ